MARIARTADEPCANLHHPARWFADGKMGELVKQSDSEKITINIGYVDLGHIDLLVREGFIRTAPI